MKIPSLVLKQLYTFGSLENTEEGVRLTLKNRLSDAVFTGMVGMSIGGEPVPLEEVEIRLGSGEILSPSDVSPESAVPFALGKTIDLVWKGHALDVGKHQIGFEFTASPFGTLSFKVKDSIRLHKEHRVTVPIDKEDDYSTEIVAKRQDFVREYTGADPKNIFSYSFDPSVARGNIECFTGVAQIPIGFAGPIKINGEHAIEFMIHKAPKIIREDFIDKCLEKRFVKKITGVHRVAFMVQPYPITVFDSKVAPGYQQQTQ